MIIIRLFVVTLCISIKFAESEGVIFFKNKSISDYDTYFEEFQKILQRISDNLEISKRQSEAKRENVRKVFEAINEYMKTSMKIAEDESIESFIIKQHLLLHLMMKELMTRQESSITITESIKPKDCSELLSSGVTKSGFYFLYPFKNDDKKQVKVYCDMETDGGGWTVFLQRTKTLNPLSFTRNWDSYKNGFGSEEEFWLGNQVLHTLTFNRKYSLKLEAKDTEGKETWSFWNSIVVHSEDEKFKLEVTGRDSKSTEYNVLGFHTNNYFSTYDRDNDRADSSNCAEKRRGGWWYGGCYFINPTGEYGKPGDEGILIYPWTNKAAGKRQAIWLQLKIRPLVCC